MSLRRGPMGVVVQVLLAVVLVGVGGCSSGSEKDGPGGNKSSAALPAGPDTLRKSSEAMRSLTSVGFVIATEGTAQLLVKGGDVKLLKSGDAQGSLQIQQLGMAFDTQFVLLGETLYFKGLTGSGYQKTDKERIAAYYDPSAVLDPERGISKLLTVVQNPQVEAREKVNGEDAYRVKGTLPKDAAHTLVPGVQQALAGQLWIAADDHRLLKVRAQLPAADGKAGAATVNFTEFNTDYKITAPA
jgi:lipoprotein LprG